MLVGRVFLAVAALLCTVAAFPSFKKDDTKYFHEPGKGDLSGHYDSRYYKEVVSYDTRLDTLKHMVRAWLQMTEKEGIETWIAHGTLLGWWWNAQMLPWDWDLDVQVHANTLTMMGQKYNQTSHKYQPDDGTAEREYFLDVNWWIWQRDRGDGKNVIDARWVDKRTGLYIDITGIAEADPKRNPGVLNCKNWHRYRYDDIWPLRDTTFEGVPAKIPYNFDAILIKEYNTKALTVTEYEGHRWNVREKVWERVLGDQPKGTPSFDKSPNVPEKYSTVETGGFFHNIYRLVHWWA